MSAAAHYLSSQRTIGRMLVLLCGTAATATLGFLIQFVLARGLSVPSYGRLAAILAVANVLTPLTSCGMGWLWFQVYGSEGWAAQRWISVSMRAVAHSSSVAVGLMVGYLVATEQGPVATIVFVCGAMFAVLLSQGLVEMTFARLQLEERYGLLAAWQLCVPFGRALVVAPIFFTGYRDLSSVLVGYALVGMVAGWIAIVSLEQVRRGRIRLAGHGPPTSANLSPPVLRQVLLEAAPYVLMTTFYLVYSQGIVAVVERLLAPGDAAIYNVAFLILSAVYLVPSVIYTKYLVSKIFRWWAQDRQKFHATFHVGVATQLVLGLLGMTVVMLAAPPAVSMLFGPRYEAAVPVIMVSALAIPIRFVQHAYASAFYSREQMLRKVGYMGLAAAISVVLNVMLTPVMGLTGAAISGIGAELSLLLLFFWGAARHIDGIDVWSTFRPRILRKSLAYIASARGDMR
jgi:O-antigen/teichoic acid export membrane protein